MYFTHQCVNGSSNCCMSYVPTVNVVFSCNIIISIQNGAWFHLKIKQNENKHIDNTLGCHLLHKRLNL